MNNNIFRSTTYSSIDDLIVYKKDFFNNYSFMYWLPRHYFNTFKLGLIKHKIFDNSYSIVKYQISSRTLITPYNPSSILRLEITPNHIGIVEQDKKIIELENKEEETRLNGLKFMSDFDSIILNHWIPDKQAFYLLKY